MFPRPLIARLSPPWPLLIVALAALLLAAAACGGNGGDGEEEDRGPAAEAPAGEDADGANADGEDFFADLGELSEKWQTTSATVSYDLTDISGGEESSMTVTLYWRPPDSWRMDMFPEDEPGLILINVGTTSYLCTVEDESCLQMEVAPEDAVDAPFVGLFLDPGDVADFVGEAFENVRTFSDSVAGEDARCYAVSGVLDEDEEGEGTICFSDDGILLLLDGTSVIEGEEETFKLEATSVERSVSDSDFEPPYPTTELPGLDDFDLE